MRIDFLFLGKTKESYLAAGIEDFCKRLKRYTEVEIRILKDVKPGRKPERQIRQEEGDILLSHLYPSTLVVALDPGGKQLSSEDLARSLEEWQNNGRQQVTILLGGALGLSDKVLERADLVLSLSGMTFTHEMARLIIMEQLYRAFNIKAGTGYHK